MASETSIQTDGEGFLHFRIGEYFSGPGGLSLAATLAASDLNGEVIVEHVWAVDNDESACRTYRHNIPVTDPDRVMHADVREINKNISGNLSEIDGFLFGFPCNDFSIVGKQRGTNGQYGPLYEEAVKVLDELRPKWFVAENVSGLRSANEGRAFRKILSSFEESGYKIVPHEYHFEDYEVPQTRHRIIVVGIRDDIDIDFEVPAATSAGNPVSARKALSNIPASAPNQEKTIQSKTVIERLKYIKPGENAFNADIPEKLRLNIKGATLSQIYKRLDPDKPSYTITGSGGGGTHGYHWTENRALTNRERARLQTFPDNYEFLGSKEQIRRQIGMAVPPEGARHIFKALFKTFLNHQYRSVESNIEIRRDLDQHILF